MNSQESVEDDQGKDSRLGTDSGHIPHQSQHWASNARPLHPSSVPGGTGCWDTEADEDFFQECGNEGHSQQRGWVSKGSLGRERGGEVWGEADGEDAMDHRGVFALGCFVLLSFCVLFHLLI